MLQNLAVLSSLSDCLVLSVSHSFRSIQGILRLVQNKTLDGSLAEMPMFRCCLLYCNAGSLLPLTGLFECFTARDSDACVFCLSLHAVLPSTAQTPASLPPIMSIAYARSVFAFLVHTSIQIQCPCGLFVVVRLVVLSAGPGF